MIINISRERLVIIIAIVVAAAGVAIYYFSGQGSLQENRRRLINSSPNVQEVQIRDQTDGHKTVEVKCGDGSSYEIYMPPDATNFDSLATSQC